MKTQNEYYSYINNSIAIKQICDKCGIQTNQVGNDYTCSCIYHNDPHPSMHIYTQSNSFYCFECNKGGNLFNFIEDKLNCNFNESIQWLEKEYPDLLKEKPVWNLRTESNYQRSGYQIAYEVYQKMTPYEEEKFHEFVIKRGYTEDFLTERDIFYAKGKKLHSAYVASADDHIEELENLKECGMLKALPWKRTWKEQHYEDFSPKDRVIFTLRNTNGRICGFAARSVRESDKPKYLFSRNLKKSELLYRFDHVKKNLKDDVQNQQIYITEGFFDALRLESENLLAVAVLGSSLANNQIKILEDEIGEKNVSLRLFLDADEAGQKGTVNSLSKIWKSKVLKRCYVDVVIVESNAKDPDEACREKKENNSICSGFEFLMRYYMKEQGQPLSQIDVKERFEAMSVEERISFLHKLEGILPKQEWKGLFDFYDGIIGEQGGLSEENVKDKSYWLIRQFILGKSVNNFAEKNTKSGLFSKSEKNYYYQMQTALQIVRTSYEREEVCLEEGSWDRIAFGADAFFDYLYHGLENDEKISIPLFSMMIPKKYDVQRKKQLYCHEELLLQQYVLNELLASSPEMNYERNIPAVRYRRGAGTYLTGYEYQDISEETLSYAYQIDMDVINGTTEIKNGMFRPFYDCWKEYVGYIQDGIEKMESETIYRVKLDIQGFYDNLSKFVVRNALYKSVQEALRYDKERFAVFGNDDENDNRAKRVVSWILDELFKVEYYDACTGELKEKTDSNQGIPQGPNLSAYAANVALFLVDQKVAKLLQEANAGCQEGKIRARYARYVDDMIIIASSPEILMKIKSEIASQLYDLGLNLSPKTEAEDGISKEEAGDWIISERGGFGVSAGFDLADDAYDTLLEEYEDYEVTDRRAALRLLQSNMYTLLYEDDIEEEELCPQFFNVFFQTEDIRYRDIARFSEMLLFYAAKSDDLLKEYRSYWDEGVKHSLEDSLFLEDGLDMLVLLSGCIKILQRQKNSKNLESRAKWGFVEEAIKKNTEKICKNIETAISNDNILGINKWALSLKMIELCGLAQKWKYDLRNIGIKNEYTWRWIWDASKSPDDINKFQINSNVNINLLQNFSWFIEKFMRMQRIEDFKEVKSQVQNYIPEYGTKAENILLDCIRIWIFEESDISYIKDIDDSKCTMALRVLLSTVPESLKAEVVNEIPLLKKYLFKKSADQNEFLPVYPGIAYPGIMALEKKSDKNNQCEILKVHRVDFIREDTILNEAEWNEISTSDKHTKRSVYERNLEGDKYNDLKHYIQGKNLEILHSAVECMKIICDVYEPLKDIIDETNQRIKQKYSDKNLILSDKNVFIKKEGGRVLLDIQTAYLISDSSMTNAVAVSGGNDTGRYTLRKVYEDGQAYWISGYLLKDACNLDAVLLRDSIDGNTKKDAEMLNFSMRRLYGSSFENYRAAVGKKRSYQVSVQRTIELMKEYTGSNMKESDKALYLENARITNSFIKRKMECSVMEHFEMNLGYAIWTKNYLRFGFKHLISHMKDTDIVSPECPVKRRVPRCYYMLADSLMGIVQKNPKFSGLRVLAAGLYADGVLMHLRMQVLEGIFSLDREQKKKFMELADELPLAELGLDDKDVLITEGDIVSVYKDFLDESRYNTKLKNITHLGWLVLLAKVYEADKSTGFIVFDSQHEINREKIKSDLKEIIRIIKSEQKKDQSGQEEFPFDGMTKFFFVWQKKNVDQIFNKLVGLDLAYGTEIKEMESDEFRMSLEAKRVKIRTEWEDYDRPPYFVTYGKLNRNVSTIEHSMKDSKFSIFTQTVIRNRVVGFSAVEQELGELLQHWETSNESKEEHTAVDETLKTKEIELIQVKKEETDTKEVVQASDANEGEDSEHKKTDEDQSDESYIRGFQKAAWEKRGGNKPFQNADRIAVFQFRIDSSYKHPSAEKCSRKEYEEKKSENMGYYLSCAEFRRRNLLKTVMKTCHLFDVDILLLPEYSVRPETVIWMRNQIEEKGYHFSVWAGTFRIPAGYRMEGDLAELDTPFNKKMYWHSAPLPIITPNAEHVPEIVIEKFKKYPSVALEEDINPVPAYAASSNKLNPIMQIFQNCLNEKLKEKIDIFGDARDDVIELICAELFAVSSISNFPSFVSGSLNAYMRYSSNDKKENKEIYDLYVQKYLEDIRSFGEATAIYQRRNDKKIEKRKPRRPILLVPACTTRAVDYYVFGQGFYLSAGLKTVFCNSVGTGGRGGSCFIGPDSWDDYKINKNEFLMQNTIYHGLKPGIYMQTEPDKCRGALGSEEQALLICDVQPHLDKGNPNAESMMSAFSLVAHIPVFEEKRYVGQSDGKDGKNTIKCYGKCEKQRYCHDMVEENLKQYLGDIENYCKKYEAEQGYRLSAQDENAKKDKIIEKMKALGEYYKSDWFIKRAEYYAKYRWTYPQAWPPPTLTDWLFIETDYDKFRKKEIDADLGECRIQIPEYED
jgi:hypothetical protein